MITKTVQRAIIGSFLIIGTLLALYLTINVGYDLFCVHKAWMYRDGLIQKIGFVVISADFALLAIAGLVSTVSFFLKKQIWKPITKGIIVNIYLWLSVAVLIVGIAQTHIIFKFCSLLVIGLVIWLMSQIWKMIRQY